MFIRMFVSKLYGIVMLALTPVYLLAQSADEQLFKQKMALAKGETTAQTAVIIGQSFMGQPYKAGMLDVPANEHLVCTLKEFDCWTFVETVTALAITRHSTIPDFSVFFVIPKKASLPRW